MVLPQENRIPKGREVKFRLGEAGSSHMTETGLIFKNYPNLGVLQALFDP